MTVITKPISLRCTTQYKGMSLPDFSTFLSSFCTSMQGNDTFKTLDPQVAVISKQQTEFVTLVAVAAKGSEQDKLDRDTLQLAIYVNLDDIGVDITKISANNQKKILSSGMPFTKVPQPTPDMTEPPAPKLKNPLPGQIKCLGQSQGGKKDVTYFLTTDPTLQTGWTPYYGGGVRYTITDAPRSVPCFVKFVMTGPRGQHVESAVARIVTQ